MVLAETVLVLPGQSPLEGWEVMDSSEKALFSEIVGFQRFSTV
jgi:hypothetical protein